MAKLYVCFILVITFAGCALGNPNDDLCELEEQCEPTPELSEKFPFDTEEIVFPEGDYLRQHCSELVSLLECFANRNRSCNDVPGKSIPIRNFDSHILLLRDICDEDSSLRKRYERLAHCLNNNITEFSTVLQIFVHNAFSFVGLVDLELRRMDRAWHPEELNKVENCLMISYFNQEYRSSISRICSSEDADTFGEISFRIFKPIEVLCPATDETIQHYLQGLETYRSQQKPIQNVLLDLMEN